MSSLHSNSYTVREFGRLIPTNNTDTICNNPDKCEIPEKTFKNLKNFIFENIEYSKEISKSFLYSIWNRQENIQVKNYVGIIETADGKTIEILPKIHLPEKKDNKKETRMIFLRMLKRLKNSPFAQIETAHLKSQEFPILEVFISAFIKELEKLIKLGIKQSYVNIEENINYYKGKLKVSENIRHNLTNKARFYMQYDEYSQNIPQNRLLKSAIQYLLNKSGLISNQITLKRFCHIYFENIEESRNIEKDFAKVSGQNRLYSHYTQALNWASVFLRNESFTSFKGDHLNKAILFPMERIFEDYVSYLFERYDKKNNIETQKCRHWLVENHNERKKFRLIPDIVSYKENEIKVYDTKWKIIDQNRPSENYHIKQSDMYQLFAYGEKYMTDSLKENNADEKISVSLYLLYPKTEKFEKPLSHFEYGENLVLNVIPVDLELQDNDIYKKIQEKSNP